MKPTEEVNLFPLLPLRDIVVFPHMVLPLFVGRKSSKRVIETAIERDCEIFCVTQKDAGKEYPRLDDLHEMGTVAKIPQIIKLPDGCYKILVEGVNRARIAGINDDDVCKRALVCMQTETSLIDDSSLTKVVMNRFADYAKHTDTISPEVVVA